MSYTESLHQSQADNNYSYRKSYMNQSLTPQNAPINQSSSIQNEVFKPKSQRFQWKYLNQINVDNIKSSNDISSLNPYIENLLCSSLEQNEIQQIPENYTIQLIHLLQTIGEYLLWSQKILVNENEQLKAELKVAQAPQENRSNADDALIQTLQMQNKQKDALIKTYQHLVKTEPDVSSSYNDEDKSQRQGRVRPKFYCQFCTNKKFSTEQYLEDHMKRRHLHQMQTLQLKKQHEPDYNSKLNEMKVYFETMLRSTQMKNEYNAINGKINGLENKLIQSGMTMQNKFQTSMNEMKYLSQSGNAIPIYEHQPISMRSEEEIIVNQKRNSFAEKELQNALTQINQNIESSTDVFNNQFSSLLNDINQFKNSMRNEISKVKQEQSYERSALHRSQLKLSQVDEIKLREAEPVAVPDMAVKENKPEYTYHKKEPNYTNEQKETDITNERTITLPLTVQQDRAIPPKKRDPIIEKNESIQVDKENMDTHVIEPVLQSLFLKDLELFYDEFRRRDNDVSSLNQYKENLGILLNYSEAKSNAVVKSIDKSLASVLNHHSMEFVTFNQIEELDMNHSIDLIQVLYTEMGNSACKSDYFGFYSKNLDEILQLKTKIDLSNKMYFDKNVQKHISLNKNASLTS